MKLKWKCVVLARYVWVCYVCVWMKWNENRMHWNINNDDDDISHPLFYYIRMYEYGIYRKSAQHHTNEWSKCNPFFTSHNFLIHFNFNCMLFSTWSGWFVYVCFEQIVSKDDGYCAHLIGWICHRRNFDNYSRFC